jgi:GAF domain-containing protein
MFVPMLKDDDLIGTIAIFRQEVRSFSDKQIELVKNFASQAVIAIENARLLNELRNRTDDLTEALEQQTAAAEILSVISNSLHDTKPVFDAIVDSGLKLFPGATVIVALADGDKVDAAAVAAPNPAGIEAVRSRCPFPLTREYMHSTAILDRRIVDIPDVENAPAELEVGARNFAATGYRAVTIMPMIRGDGAIGALSVARHTPGLLTDKQRAVLKTFADQAVIAIENTRLLGELRHRTDDLSEALEQQTATSQVLQVISSSPGTLEPVFETMLEHATRICEATFGSMLLREGNLFRRVALHNAPQRYAQHSQKTPLFATSQTLGRLLEAKQAAQVADMAVAEPASPIARLGGARTLLNVPMIKENEVIGVIGIYRQEVRPFTEKQIELVTNFAAQAVIAIENTRLLNELRESLQQQTATADVLRLISTSPDELQPVFSEMLENALQICGAKFGLLYRYSDDAFVARAMVGAPPVLVDALLDKPFAPSAGVPLGRLLRTKQVIHTIDAGAEESKPLSAQLADACSHIAVPMLKDNKLIGAICIYRQEVRPFTDKQVELVSNFAQQAVIAIENARLLNELRESLEQQTATADVLRVISTSPGQLEPVFQTLLENAVRVIGSKFGTMYLREGDAFRISAIHGAPSAFVEAVMREPLIRPARESAIGRTAHTKQVVQFADLTLEETYRRRDSRAVAAVELAGVRTVLSVPMLKDNRLVGTMAIYRAEVRPFTEKQIELVQNFAAQAVIAIENTRLLNELRDSLQQQTATSEVLQVISSSPGQLKPVFNAMLENAVRLCEAKFGTLFKYDGESLMIEAGLGIPQPLADYLNQRHEI